MLCRSGRTLPRVGTFSRCAYSTTNSDKTQVLLYKLHKTHFELAKIEAQAEVFPLVSEEAPYSPTGAKKGAYV